MFGRSTIRLGIGPHSSARYFATIAMLWSWRYMAGRQLKFYNLSHLRYGRHPGLVSQPGPRGGYRELFKDPRGYRELMRHAAPQPIALYQRRTV